MTEYINKTQEVLGPLITAPKLTEKLLSKPPFRFLHDIITGFIKANKFPENLFSDDQLDSAKVADKESKIEFLRLFISVVEAATHKTCAAKPQKIVAGQEPENTNQLLQLLAECATLTEKQKTAAVQSAKNSGKSAAAPTESKAEAKKDEKKKSVSETQEEKAKAQDDKEKKEKAKKEEEKKEEEEKKKKKEEEERQQQQEAAAKAKAKAEAEEKEKERKAREQRREKEKREKAEKEKAEKEKLKREQEEQAAKENKAKQQQEEEQQKQKQQEEEQKKANEKKERSSDEERHRHRHHHHREHEDGNDANNDAKIEQDEKDKKKSRHHRSSESERGSKEKKSSKNESEEHDDNEEVFKRQLAPSPSANSPSGNETQSAGKAPPKTRKTHEVISSQEEHNKTSNTQSIHDNNDEVQRDDKKDGSASRHKRGLQGNETNEEVSKDSKKREKQSGDASAIDKNKANKANAKFGGKNKNNDEDDKDDDDDDDDAHNWEKIAEQFEKRSAMQRAGGHRGNINNNEEDEEEIKGVLGQQALRAKKDQETVEAAERFGEHDEVDNFLSKNATGHDESGIVIRNKRTTHGRDATGLVLSDHELQRLREQIQQLTKASNPLGKFLEVIHNDIDSMTRELEMWRAEARNQVMAAAEARRQTQEGLQEVQAQIQNVNEAIADQLIKINNMRRTIINNDRAVDGMVRMIVTPDAGK